MECYFRNITPSGSIGGSGHDIEVGEAGFSVRRRSLFHGTAAVWIPWEEVAACEAVAGIASGSESNPAGSSVALREHSGTNVIADPAGDRILGYWRLYRRRVQVLSG